jgi:hypothetical protein
MAPVQLRALFWVPEGGKNYPKIVEFFSRQAPRNPIERPKTGEDAGPAGVSPVQKNFKNLKKNLVSQQSLQ